MRTLNLVGSKMMNRQHKSTDAMRILGTGGVVIVGSTRRSTTTLNAAEEPTISQTVSSTPLPRDTLRTTRLVQHHRDSQTHLSILKPLAAPTGLSCQVPDVFCRLKRESYSSRLRIIPSTEASSGAHLQTKKVDRTHQLSCPPIPIWFIPSSLLPRQTRANGHTIIIINNNNGAIRVTGVTGNDHETGDAILSMDI